MWGVCGEGVLSPMGAIDAFTMEGDWEHISSGRGDHKLGDAAVGPKCINSSNGEVMSQVGLRKHFSLAVKSAGLNWGLSRSPPTRGLLYPSLPAEIPLSIAFPRPVFKDRITS